MAKEIKPRLEMPTLTTPTGIGRRYIRADEPPAASKRGTPRKQAEKAIEAVSAAKASMRQAKSKRPSSGRAGPARGRRKQTGKGKAPK